MGVQSDSGMVASGLARPSDAVEAEAIRGLPGTLSITVVHEDGDWRSFSECERAVTEAAVAIDRRLMSRAALAREAAVVLGSDQLVRQLNRTYCGKDAATNVLSFPYRASSGTATDGIEYLGDVVLAAETVQREAEQRGITPNSHLQHLVVHGLLHLLGYDHASDSEADVMEGLETEILAGLGVADPYAVEAPE